MKVRLRFNDVMRKDKPISEGEVRQVAVFTARNHFAEVNAEGNLVVYFRKPVKTLDRRVKDIAEDIYELVRTNPEKHSKLLAEINKKNSEFWRERNDQPITG
jgi:hypothetical protein